MILQNIHLAPKFDVNEGKGVPPRYCPSIETKALRFYNRTHQIWLEPESLTSDTTFFNGFTTALPFEIQK